MMMRLRSWLVLALVSCTPATKPAPVPPVVPVASAPEAAAPEPASASEPAPAPPAPTADDVWTPTFAGSGGPYRSSAPPRLGGDASKPAAGEKYVVRLERTACFGSCPTYVVEISADGTVLFIDKDSPHRATGTVAAADVTKLVKRLRDVGFFRLAWTDPCPQRWTDNPGAIVTFVDHGRKRTVDDDHGNMCIPSLMRDLEDEIDHVGSTAAWHH